MEEHIQIIKIETAKNECAEEIGSDSLFIKQLMIKSTTGKCNVYSCNGKGNIRKNLKTHKRYYYYDCNTNKKEN